jgi:hypothetical protein
MDIEKGKKIGGVWLAIITTITTTATTYSLD